MLLFILPTQQQSGTTRIISGGREEGFCAQHTRTLLFSVAAVPGRTGDPPRTVIPSWHPVLLRHKFSVPIHRVCVGTSERALPLPTFLACFRPAANPVFPHRCVLNLDFWIKSRVRPRLKYTTHYAPAHAWNRSYLHYTSEQDFRLSLQ